MRQSIRYPDGVHKEKSVPKRLSFAEHAHRFRITEMRVHIHESDFTTEERSRFCSPKDLFRPAIAGDRFIHERRAVGK